MLISVQTPAAGGTVYAQFAAQWCQNGNGYLLNDTGTSLDVKIGADASPVAVASGKGFPFKLVYSCGELYVRRTDQSATQVTVEAQVGITVVPSDGGGTSGPIAAADITDLAAGRGPLLTGTPAQAREAIGAMAVVSHTPGLVMCGSSSAAYHGFNNYNGATLTTGTARGYINNGIALSGGRLKVLANLAVPSTLVSDHETQFVAALAMSPQIIDMQSFSNDIAASATAATLYTYLVSWANRCAAAGIHLIVRSSSWRPGLSAAQMKEFMRIRELTRVIALGNQWVHNIDGYGDMQDDTNTAGGCRANYLLEGIHPTCLAAYVNGKSYAALFTQLLPPLPYHFADAYDENLVGNQWLRNPTLSIPGGTLGANCSGVAPLYWQLDISTVASRSDGLTTTVVGSVITDTDGRKAFQIDITNAIIGDMIRLYHPQSNTPSPVTGFWEIGCVVKYISGGILTQPEFAALMARCLQREPTAAKQFAIPAEGQTFTMVQDTPSIGSGAYVGAYLYLPARNAAAGNATVVVKSPTIRWLST